LLFDKAFVSQQGNCARLIRLKYCGDQQEKKQALPIGVLSDDRAGSNAV